MNYYSIIKRPVITEKSNTIMQQRNAYTFIIGNNARKKDVKKAVESLYGVTVQSVNILRVGGKIKRSWVKRRNQYVEKGYKKAIVKLVSKDSIKIFEEVKK